MVSTKERLAALREYVATLSANKTTFIVEGGRGGLYRQRPLYLSAGAWRIYPGRAADRALSPSRRGGGRSFPVAL